MLDNMKETDILSDLDSNEDQPSTYSHHGLYIHLLVLKRRRLGNLSKKSFLAY